MIDTMGDTKNKSKEDLIATKIIELGESSFDGDGDVLDIPMESDENLKIKPVLTPISNSFKELPEPQASGEATVVVRGGQAPKEPEEVAFQLGRSPGRLHKSESAAQVEAQIGIADNLRMVQSRLQQLEGELERVRQDNEKLQSQLDESAAQNLEFTKQVENLERMRSEVVDQYGAEMQILRDNLRESEKSLARSLQQNEQLEARIGQDFRKIRVRERELENRLEIAKIEKDALLRAKDEVILDLKRKLDENSAEINTYKSRIVELNKVIEANNQQLIRTVRTLRLALTNLEGGESLLGAPLKKAD
jgi:predicted RNase H-like nuclease (RuvC/YqgF family)